MGLLGRSGSGKTTLLRGVVGIQVVAGGTVEVMGRPAGHPELRRRTGYMAQPPSIYPDLTIAESLRYFATLLRTDSGEVVRVLDAVDLTRLAARRTGTCRGASGRGCRSRSRCWGGRACSCSTSRP